MIKVRVANNLTAKEIIVDGETTVRDCFTKAGISCAKATICLDGQNLSSAQLDKSLNDLGCSDEVTVMAIIKNDNARF